ncbi:MAG: polymer-forming cytoskeletal protein [Pseudomonadota bacterium]
MTAHDRPVVVSAPDIEDQSLRSRLAATAPQEEHGGQPVRPEVPQDLEVIEVSDDEGRVFIGPGTKLVGEVSNCSKVQVEGHLDGTLVADHVIISKGGSVSGGLHAGHAEVLGAVEGNVHIEGLLDVHATGRIKGQLTYGRLSVADGGDISGEIHGPERGPELNAGAPNSNAAGYHHRAADVPEHHIRSAAAADPMRGAHPAGSQDDGLNGQQATFARGPRPPIPDAHPTK